MSFGTLYTHNPTPRAFAILAVAKQIGLKLDLVYAEKENEANYAKLLEYNPLGLVPTFVGADGLVLTESVAIALYITSQDKSTTLFGSNQLDHLQVFRWLSFFNSAMLPHIGGVLLPLMGRQMPVRTDADDSLRAMHADFAFVERHLADKLLLIGDQLTLADLFCAGTIVFAVKVFHSVLNVGYPRTMAWFGRVCEVPEFKEAIGGELVLMNIPFPRLPEHEGQA